MTDTNTSPPDIQPRASWRARSLRWLRDIALFAMFAWGIVWFQGRDMLSTDGTTTMASFRLPTLNGQVANISPATDKPTLVYFFAPWCSICRNTISHLESVDREQTNIAVIALDYASKESVEAFVRDTGLTLPVHLGTEAIRDRFQVQGYPSYYVLDESFAVVDRAMGYLTVLDLKLREL